MLPRAHRMVDPADFRSTFRDGVVAGDTMVVVHCRTDEDPTRSLVGFVVPKREIKLAVGRNRVKRRLRHLMRDRLDTLPAGARVVVRVRAAALDCSHDELATSLDCTMARAWRRWERR